MGGIRATLFGVLAIAAVLVAPAPGASASPSAGRPFADAAGYLRGAVTVPGTAWWIDAGTGRYVVSADDTVSASTLRRLARISDRAGARLVRDPGRLATRINGGESFFSAGGRCAVGFNVRRLPTYYFVTVAHCVGPVGSRVFADAARTVPLGVVEASTPMYDTALVRFTNNALAEPTAVNLYNGTFQRITSVSAGFLGQPVRRSGPVSGVRSGTITGLNATVNFPGGAVVGLIRTNVCAEPGDSGGPLFANTAGLGMTAGGSGNCSTGGVTYFASASRALARYRVTVF